MTICPEHGKDVEFRKFAVDQILLIAPLNHPWSAQAGISLQDLLDAEFILPDEGTDTQMAVQEALNQRGISLYQLKSLMVLGSSEAIGLSVKEGLGVGFVSKVVVEKLVKDQVKTIPVHGLNIYQDVYLGRSVNRLRTSAQDAFWDFVFNEKNAFQNSLEERSI
jgi:DNA-binding transcriptional LysR family regulator